MSSLAFLFGGHVLHFTACSLWEQVENRRHNGVTALGPALQHLHRWSPDVSQAGSSHYAAARPPRQQWAPPTAFGEGAGLGGEAEGSAGGGGW